jgi:hypothetical protein
MGIADRREDQIVDKNKLTYRELLIRLSDQMDYVTRDVDNLKAENRSLRDRVLQIETKIYVVGAFSIFISGALTLIINIYKTFK